jgi:hypothetical protein
MEVLGTQISSVTQQELLRGLEATRQPDEYPVQQGPAPSVHSDISNHESDAAHGNV